MIAFGYGLLVRLLYRLQACAFANGLLFLDALRLPYRNMALLRCAEATNCLLTKRLSERRARG